ncbi:hypothetical protein ACH5RR_001587 [Cinchona calisaya]|uniref:Homeobox domain-containing protein n=1 Tax=Cinchona calisaya TaxID=153742 RepID=A0ABD3B4G6_9GENT
MTEEQMEILRRQIAAYATICEQLEDLYRSLTTQNDPSCNSMLRNNPYCCTPLMTTSSYLGHNHKLPRRQRWNPTAQQLQILERIFDQGNETPSKEKVKDITSELAKHGQIAETNVYNWFQNHRARMKKKQLVETHETKVAESVEKIVIQSPKKGEMQHPMLPIEEFHGRMLSKAKVSDDHLIEDMAVNSDCYSAYMNIQAENYNMKN